MFVRFWLLCSSALLAAVGVVWLGYRLNGGDLGLGRWYREAATALAVGAAQALLLFLVWRLLGWTHWLQYLVAAAVGVIGCKLTHLNEMDEYAPFLIALAQLGAFWVALGPLARVFGDMTRRFPLVP